MTSFSCKFEFCFYTSIGSRF